MLAVLRQKVEFMPEGIAVLFVLIGLTLIISFSLNLPTRTESDWIKYDKAVVADEKGDKTIKKVTVTYGNTTKEYTVYQRALNDDPNVTIPGKDGKPVPKGTIQIEFNPNDKSDYDLFGITPAGRWEIMWFFISVGIIFTVFGLFVITVDELDKYINKKSIQ
jgi:hypothetical protein